MTIRKSASEVFRLIFSPTEDPDPRLLLCKLFLEALCSQINERFQLGEVTDDKENQGDVSSLQCAH